MVGGVDEFHTGLGVNGHSIDHGVLKVTNYFGQHLRSTQGHKEAPNFPGRDN